MPISLIHITQSQLQPILSQISLPWQQGSSSGKFKWRRWIGQPWKLYNRTKITTVSCIQPELWPWPWPWFIPYSTGHIGPHSDTIRVCQELPRLLPPRWTPSFVGLCWLRSSSSLLVDLVLSCILVHASTVLGVVCAGGPYGRHVQASEVVFLSVCCPWFVVQFWFWPPH